MEIADCHISYRSIDAPHAKVYLEKSSTFFLSIKAGIPTAFFCIDLLNGGIRRGLLELLNNCSPLNILGSKSSQM